MGAKTLKRQLVMNACEADKLCSFIRQHAGNDIQIDWTYTGIGLKLVAKSMLPDGTGTAQIDFTDYSCW